MGGLFSDEKPPQLKRNRSKIKENDEEDLNDESKEKHEVSVFTVDENKELSPVDENSFVSELLTKLSHQMLPSQKKFQFGISGGLLLYDTDEIMMLIGRDEELECTAWYFVGLSRDDVVDTVQQATATVYVTCTEQPPSRNIVSKLEANLKKYVYLFVKDTTVTVAAILNNNDSEISNQARSLIKLLLGTKIVIPIVFWNGTISYI